MKRSKLHKFKMMIFIWSLKGQIKNRLDVGEKKVKFYDVKNNYWIYIGLKILKRRKGLHIIFLNGSIFEPDCIVTKNHYQLIKGDK